MHSGTKESSELLKKDSQRQHISPNIRESPLPSKEYLPPFQQERISLDRINASLQEELLQCSICLYVFDQPTTLSCGHSFCLDCLENLKHVRNDCPACRSPLPRVDSLKKNYILAQMVENLVLPCPSHRYDTKKNCQERVKIKDLEKHWKSCPHMQFKCECGDIIDIASYLETDRICKCPQVKCKYCFLMYQERLIKYHTDDCMRKGVKCKYCGSIYNLESHESHQRLDCFSFCDYKDYGCPHETKMTQGELKDHYELNRYVHNFLLLRELSPEVAASFFQRTYEFNSKIPDSEEGIVIYVKYKNATRAKICNPQTRTLDILRDMISRFSLEKNPDFVELRFKEGDKTGFLSKSRLLSDYNVQHGQTLELCIAEKSDSSRV